MTDTFSLFDDAPIEPPKKPKKTSQPAPEPDADSLFTEDPALLTEPVAVPATPREPPPPVVIDPDKLPPFLDQIWGQDRPKQVFKRLIAEDHLPHAILLYGPDGIGKQQVALEIARHLNCEYGPLTACGQCQSCRQFETLQHSSLFLAFPTKANDGEVDRREQLDSGETRITRRYSTKTEEEIASVISEVSKDHWTPITVPGATNLRVITIRFLRQWAQFGTWMGRGKKVAIITPANRMNEETSNALLKILEEPPPDTLLILISRSPDELLPTIQSRCQAIRLDPLPASLIAAKLLELPQSKLRRESPLQEHDAHEIAELSEGSFLRARETASMDFEVKTDAAVNFLLGIVRKQNRKEYFQQLDAISRSRNVEEVDKFLIRIVLFLRDSLRLRQHTGDDLPPALFTRGDALITRLKNFTNFTRDRDLVRGIEEVLKAQDTLRHRNPQHLLLMHALGWRLHQILSP